MVVADLIVSLHSAMQQRAVACDFVSCMPRRASPNLDYHQTFTEKSRMKRKKYASYDVSAETFFPLPFGRANSLSLEVFELCSLVGGHFPNHFHAERNIRAAFARAIYVGTSQLFNLAVRRLQLSVTARVKIPAVSPAAVLSPFASLSQYRLIRRAPSKFSSVHALLLPPHFYSCR
jgi:hypothetical protein